MVGVVPLKDKKGVIVVNAFQKVLDDSMKLHSKRKPNKIWVDMGNEFYNSSFKKWLKGNNVKIQHTIKVNLLLLKDFSEIWKTRFTNAWLQYQNMCILIN